MMQRRNFLALLSAPFLKRFLPKCIEVIKQSETGSSLSLEELNAYAEKYITSSLADNAFTSSPVFERLYGERVISRDMLDDQRGVNNIHNGMMELAEQRPFSYIKV